MIEYKYHPAVIRVASWMVTRGMSQPGLPGSASRRVLDASYDPRNLPSVIGETIIGANVVAIMSIPQSNKRTTLTHKTWFKGESEPMRELVWHGTD